MNPNLTISLVILAYNEEESIHGFFARVSPIMESVGYDYEFFFVDDGSRDNTASKAKVEETTLFKQSVNQCSYFDFSFWGKRA